MADSDYGLASEKELKEIRSVTKKNVEAAQRRQKTYYDKGSRDSVLKVGNFVMLKVQPKFKLERHHKGPFVIKLLMDTNAVIQLKDDVDAEELNVSRHCLSKCGKLY